VISRKPVFEVQNSCIGKIEPRTNSRIFFCSGRGVGGMPDQRSEEAEGFGATAGE